PGARRTPARPGPRGWPRSGRGPRTQSADDLAAPLLALRLRSRHEGLAPARVLPGAAVAGTCAGALALARVDAETLHVTARLLLGAGLNGSGCQERRGQRRHQDSLAHAIHSCLLCLPTMGRAIGLPT